MKYFVFSDAHGFTKILKEALDKAGYDENNPKHYLVGCGDYLDRGPSPSEMISFLSSQPRCTLVKGNHEYLMEQMLKNKYLRDIDYSNGTYLSLLDLDSNTKLLANKDDYSPGLVDKLFKNGKKEILPFYKKMVDYFETKNYVFVHGYIPCEYTPRVTFRCYHPEYRSDWRDATKVEWEQAGWYNGVKFNIDNGIRIPDKTIVCGHWHCSWGHMIDKLKSLPKDSEEYFSLVRKDFEFGDGAIWEPYYGNGVIAIDRCTAHTKEINILVIEDEPL